MRNWIYMLISLNCVVPSRVVQDKYLVCLPYAIIAYIFGNILCQCTWALKANWKLNKAPQWLNLSVQGPMYSNFFLSLFSNVRIKLECLSLVSHSSLV